MINLEKISILITDYYIRKNIIDASKREIYIYGFKLIFSDIINYSLVIVMGIFLNCLIESIVFLITLCGLRIFSGGFHAKTFWVCRISMVLTFIGVMGVTYLLKDVHAISKCIVIIDAISFAVIAFLAPVQNPNKPLTIKQIARNRKKSIIASIFISIISMIFMRININIGVTISNSFAAVAILMIVGLAVSKGGK